MPDRGDHDRIVEALDATRQLVADLDERSRAQDSMLQEIRHDFRSVTETVERLSTLMWTSNGHDSFVTRLTLAERDMADVKAMLKEHRAAQVRLKAAVLPAMIGLIGAIATALIALLRT